MKMIATTRKNSTKRKTASPDKNAPAAGVFPGISTRLDNPHQDTRKVTIRAHVDRLSGGQLVGWAFDTDAPNALIDLDVYDGQELVGQGRAEAYREDLAKAGMGNGCHGFSIFISKSIDDGKPHRLVLIDSASGLPCLQEPFEVEIKSEWSGRLHPLDGLTIKGEFQKAGNLPESVRVAVFADHLKIGETTGHLDQGKQAFVFHCVLPGDVFDGNAHVLSAALMDYVAPVVSLIDILRPVLTPWRYLAQGKDVVGSLYAGLPANVSRRLASFKERVADASSKRDFESIQTISAALEVLNQGYEGRTKFPRLELPEPVESPDVSIIIPVHNKFELTYHCLASLILSRNDASFEVIVVDDCSTDKTIDIADIVGNVRVIVNSTNLGFLRNCNKAAAVAKGRYIVLLNNDTEVGNRWLDEMLDVFKRFDRVGAVGAKLVYPDGKLQEAGGVVWDNGQPWNLGRDGNPFDPEWNYVRQCDYLSGAALMLPTDVWNGVGGLSEEFAPAYYEDTDLAFKVRAAGFRTVYAPHAEVIHFEGMSHGRDTSSGYKKYQEINAPKFTAKWIDALAHNGRLGVELWRNKDRGVRYRALVIDYATPEPDKNAGAYAAVQEMRLLQSHGFKLTFVPENLAHFGHYTTQLQKMGVECLHAPFNTSVLDVLQKRGHEFDLVFITRYDVAERHIDAIRQYTRAKVLFNNADLHFLRELRMALANGDKDLSGPLATRDRELALMRKVDAILSYNETEHAVIASHNLREDNIFKCPWVINARGHKTPFEEREGIAFLGGYRHLPNVEAVEFFVEKVMPLLRASGKKIAFHIYGSHPPESFKKLECEDIVLKGYVESLDEIFETCRIFVAPLRSGAGIKGKVLDAMSYGIPSVLSPVAAEATGLSHGQSTLIADTPDEWVKQIISLYGNKGLWGKISDNNLAVALESYSFDNGWALFGKTLGYMGLFGGNRSGYMLGRQNS